MLYELGDHRIDMPGHAPPQDAHSRYILWFDGRVLLNGDSVAWPAEALPEDAELVEFVAMLNGHAYFTASLSASPGQVESCSLREVAYLGETQFMMCGRARAHLDWVRQHRFCGQCGQPVTQVAGEFAKQCQPCRLRFYPRISPCIIVLITRGREVLLAQGEKHREQGWYSTLAGFIESGESAEQAVIREVKEEVNVELQNLQYLNSQAWPFPNQLMLGYQAEYSGGEIIAAPGEIADARWFDIDALPKVPPAISIAGWMIRRYQRLLSGN